MTRHLPIVLLSIEHIISNSNGQTEKTHETFIKCGSPQPEIRTALGLTQ
jgi:hypothetical protein